VMILTKARIPVTKLRYVSYLLASSIALEVAGYPKPGNVHRLRDFSDTIFEDFLVAAIVAEHQVFRAVVRGCKLARGFSAGVVVGDLIETTVVESKMVSGGGNTCLGSALLLYPLALASGYATCMNGGLEAAAVVRYAKDLLYKHSTALDSVHFYNAIRAASPSYIKRSDVTGSIPNVWDNEYREKLLSGNHRLWDILVHSAKSDIVCAEIVESYTRSLRNSVFLENRLRMHGSWNQAVVETYLYQLAHDADTLIARKHGFDEAVHVSQKALEVLKRCISSYNKCLEVVKGFDDELAEKGINPGSTADIVVASIALHAIQKKNSVLRR
jgi:triphosphoribosyl-dephospho-CoA synthase